MKKNSREAVSYSIFYEQDSEGGFIASVPVLPGCHTQAKPPGWKMEIVPDCPLFWAQVTNEAVEWGWRR